MVRYRTFQLSRGPEGAEVHEHAEGVGADLLALRAEDQVLEAEHDVHKELLVLSLRGFPVVHLRDLYAESMQT